MQVCCILAESINNNSFKTNIMKAVFKITGENVSKYRSIGNKGYEFIQEVSDEKEFYDVIQALEDQDFFPQADGTVLRASENEAFDPDYPEEFDFVDYRYFLIETDELDEYDDAHILNSMK